MAKNVISLNEFMKYKQMNKELLPDLVIYYNNNKNKFNQNNNYKKSNQKNSENWLLINKFKQNDEEKLYSQFRSILNKLSDSNFNNLAKEISKLEIIKSEHLIKLAEFILNKAIIESKFSSMYAKLSKELSNYFVKENDKIIYFRELFINRCQIMFNDCISFDKTLENKIHITKEIATGCMILIGELFNCNLLTSKIINNCFSSLLTKIDQNKAYNIDCLCFLMKTVCANFSLKSPKECKFIFEKIEKLIKTNLTNKEKFILMDIIDLKNQFIL